MVKYGLTACLLLISACDGGDRIAAPAMTVVPPPNELLQQRAIDRNQLVLEVSVNGSVAEIVRNQTGDNWSVIVNANANSQNLLSIRWMERTDAESLLLASRDVTFSTGSVGQTLTLDDQYITTGQELDLDGDGISNLAERLAGSDPGVADFEQVDLTEPVMMPIPAGCFQMGSPESEPGRLFTESLHEVCVDAFSLGAFEVTLAEFDLFAESTNRELPDADFETRGRLPVGNVTWVDATTYAAWLSAQTGMNYRLPTEAEWEYAARAGTTSPFNTGEFITTNQANFDGRVPQYGASEGIYRGAAVAVGSFAPNGFGLYDMHGNVGEWTCTRRIVAYDGDELLCHDDPAEDTRAVRGGDFRSMAVGIRSADRDNGIITSINLRVGFRLARD